MENPKRESIALQVFYACLFMCVAIVLFLVWTEKGQNIPWLPKLAATAFVIGFAAFLIWLVPLLKGVKEKIEKK